MASTRFSSKGGRAPAVVGALAFAMVCVLAVLSAYLRSQDTSLGGVTPTDEVVCGTGSQLDCDHSEEDGSLSKESDVTDKSESIGRTLENLASDGDAHCTEEHVVGEVDEAAAQTLQRYSRDDACLLVSAGYLDCLGDVWGCVMEGLGWVDVCVIQQQADKTCVVRTVRLESGGREQGDAT